VRADGSHQQAASQVKLALHKGPASQIPRRALGPDLLKRPDSQRQMLLPLWHLSRTRAGPVTCLALRTIFV
jgi:hypothetical protein